MGIWTTDDATAVPSSMANLGAAVIPHTGPGQDTGDREQCSTPFIGDTALYKSVPARTGIYLSVTPGHSRFKKFRNCWKPSFCWS